MLRMRIGGAEFRLDPAAISAIRFRAEYGKSVMTAMDECETARETEGQLLRMCRMMIPPADRPELREFARLCRRDADFIGKALLARGALLAVDPGMELPHAETGDVSFDEYDTLALMARTGVDMALVYELPILHLASVAIRAARIGQEAGEARKMTDDEFASLFPRWQGA